MKKPTTNPSTRANDERVVREMFSGVEFSEFDMALAIKTLRPFLDCYHDGNPDE